MDTLVQDSSEALFKAIRREAVPLFHTPALEDDSVAWVVTDGFIDLFMFQLRADGSQGARHQIGRIEPGEALLPLSSLPDRWSLAPLPSSSGKAIPVPFGELIQLGRDELTSAEIDRVLRRWTGMLCAALPESDLQPKSPTLLLPGDSTAATRETVPLAPREANLAPLVWVFVEGGTALLMGRPALRLPSSTWLPLPPPAWLETASAVKTLSTIEMIEGELATAALRAFEPVVLAGIVHDLNQRDERERLRLIRKQRGDSNRVTSSIKLLGGTLKRGADTESFPNADLGNPLMTALDAIGKVQGIVFRPPPELLRGAPLRDPVAAVTRASGVRSRRVVLTSDSWNQSESPFLAFRESDKAPIACLPTSGKRYDAYDPVTDTRQRLTPELLTTFEPFAHVFFRSFPHKAITAKDLMLFGVKGSGRDIFFIILVGLLGSLLSLATPIVTGTIFDTIIPGAQRSRLLMTAFILGVASITSVIFNLTRAFAMLRVEGKMDAKVQAAIWDRLLGLPVSFFRQFSAGDLASRGLAVSSMRQILTGSALSSLMSGIFSVTSFCLLFYYSSHLAILATGLTFVALLVTTGCSFLQLRQQRDMLELHGKLTGTVLQFLLGIAKLRVSGTENRAFISWANTFARQKMFSVRSRRISNFLNVFNTAFPVASLIGIFYLTAYEMAQPGVKPLTTGEFLAFNSAYAQFSGAVLSLASVFLSLLQVVPLYERAKPILTSLPEVDTSKPFIGDLTGAIELNHVTFRYREDGPPVLKDIDVNIRPGEFVAFVGPSGAGKSTLFRLLLGFDVPETGTVFFDGQDLQSVDIQSVRQQMGVVIQNSSLFSGDIFSNIACAAPYTMDEVAEAAKLAGLEKDLSAMPMGLHTVVGDGGSGLSGGQRQRLMIARAIVGKPRVLLFDEATSALDNQTQALVSKSLEDLNSTRVVIAHRLSTVVNADRIYVVEAGSIVQSGTYQQLIEQPGLFAELAKRQIA